MFNKIATGCFLDFDKSKFESIPEIIHAYGEQQPVQNEASWMTYDRPAIKVEAEQGKISFSSQTYAFMPEFTDSVIEMMREKLSTKVNWDRKRVRIIRTIGYVPPHRDEARISCINIGLCNSNSGITHFSKNNTYEDFKEPRNTNSYICQDGDAYLLDVRNIHCVFPTGVSQEPRYLITYGFKEDFNTLNKYLFS